MIARVNGDRGENAARAKEIDDAARPRERRDEAYVHDAELRARHARSVAGARTGRVDEEARFDRTVGRASRRDFLHAGAFGAAGVWTRPLRGR